MAKAIGADSRPNSEGLRPMFIRWRAVEVLFSEPLAVKDYSERIANRFESEPSIIQTYTPQEIVKYINTLVALRVAIVNRSNVVNGARVREYVRKPVIPAPVSQLLQQIGRVKNSRLGYEYQPSCDLEVLSPADFEIVSNKLERMGELGLGEPGYTLPRDEEGDPQFMSLQVGELITTSDEKCHDSQAMLAAFYHISQKGHFCEPLLSFGDSEFYRRRVDELIR